MVFIHSFADSPFVVKVNRNDETLSSNKLSRLTSRLVSVFLPNGYPHSVSSDYLEYQIWDTVQAFCSTITNAFSTHEVLKSIGVGSETRTILSATIVWLVKDGCGHLGKIVFAYWKGAELDINSKKWRVRADILNDIGSVIETFVLPRFSNHVTHILCATSLIKSIVGVAGTATRAALTLHHAIQNNFADVSSKDSAQETFVNLAASFLSLFLLSNINNDVAFSVLFAIFTMLHIFANIKAVKSICLNSFNEARYLIVLEEYFKSGIVLHPKIVNKMERVTIGQTVTLNSTVKIGCCAQSLIDAYPNTYDLESITSLFDSSEFFIVAEVKFGVGIYLHQDNTPLDILKSYFFAASFIQDRLLMRDAFWEVQNKWNDFLCKSKNQGIF